ncbi:unnamed protein product, partial [Trichobilharzia szidati]
MDGARSRLRECEGCSNSNPPSEPWVYGKWEFGEYYYAGKVHSRENTSCCRIVFDDGQRAIVKEADIIPVYLLPIGAKVSAQIKNDNAYWGNCVIQAHLSDPDSPYEIFCRTTNEVYRLRRRQVSINETEVKNLRSQKLLPSNHVDPLVSPHCDSEVLRTNVGLSNSEENRKRRRKPKDFGADWIIPGNPRKRVKSDCIRVNDNNDLAGRLEGDEIVRGNDINEETRRQLPPTGEIVGLSNSEENRKRRRKPKDFGADWIIPGNPRKRVKSDCIRVNDNNDLAGRLEGDEI